MYKLSGVILDYLFVQFLILKIAYIMFYKQRFHSLLKHIIPKNLALFLDFPDSSSAKWIKLNQFTNGINGHGPFHRHY